jgi:hypothetical protein
MSVRVSARLAGRDGRPRDVGFDPGPDAGRTPNGSPPSRRPQRRRPCKVAAVLQDYLAAGRDHHACGHASVQVGHVHPPHESEHAGPAARGICRSAGRSSCGGEGGAAQRVFRKPPLIVPPEGGLPQHSSVTRLLACGSKPAGSSRAGRTTPKSKVRAMVPVASQCVACFRDSYFSFVFSRKRL